MADVANNAHECLLHGHPGWAFICCSRSSLELELSRSLVLARPLHLSGPEWLPDWPNSTMGCTANRHGYDTSLAILVFFMPWTGMRGCDQPRRWEVRQSLGA